MDDRPTDIRFTTFKYPFSANKMKGATATLEYSDSRLRLDPAPVERAQECLGQVNTISSCPSVPTQRQSGRGTEALLVVASKTAHVGKSVGLSDIAHLHRALGDNC